MRMLGSSVLVMEAFTMGFALLIAMNSSDAWQLIVGGVLAIALLLTPVFTQAKIGLGYRIAPADSPYWIWIGRHLDVCTWRDIRPTLDCGDTRWPSRRGSPRSSDPSVSH